FTSANNQGTRHLVIASWEGFGITSRNHYRTSGDDTFHFFRGITCNIDNFCGSRQNYICAMYSFFFHSYTFHHNTPAPNEGFILNYHWRSLQGFQHPTHTHPSRRMDVLSNLGTTPHGRPRVHHRTFI